MQKNQYCIRIIGAFSDIYIFGPIFNFCCDLLNMIISLYELSDFQVFSVYYSICIFMVL